MTLVGVKSTVCSYFAQVTYIILKRSSLVTYPSITGGHPSFSDSDTCSKQQVHKLLGNHLKIKFEKPSNASFSRLKINRNKNQIRGRFFGEGWSLPLMVITSVAEVLTLAATNANKLGSI